MQYTQKSQRISQPKEGDTTLPIEKIQQISQPEEGNIALLIDGENISFRHMAFIQSQVSRLGMVNPRRVYGDMFSGDLKRWKSIFALYSLEARHHGSVNASKTKNATDIALVVDAMLLYSQGMRKFFLVSSDSDYTPLVEVLRSKGCFMMVLGMSATPLALRKASTVFVELPALHMPKQKQTS
jgi:NYN domain